MFVYFTIVHYDDRVWGRKRLHVFKCALDEFVKASGIERTFKDVAMQNALLERQRWKN